MFQSKWCYAVGYFSNLVTLTKSNQKQEEIKNVFKKQTSVIAVFYSKCGVIAVMQLPMQHNFTRGTFPNNNSYLLQCITQPGTGLSAFMHSLIQSLQQLCEVSTIIIYNFIGGEIDDFPYIIQYQLAMLESKPESVNSKALNLKSYDILPSIFRVLHFMRT